MHFQKYLMDYSNVSWSDYTIPIYMLLPQYWGIHWRSTDHTLATIGSGNLLDSHLSKLAPHKSSRNSNLFWE